MTWNQHQAVSAILNALDDYCNNHSTVHGWRLDAKVSEGRQSLIIGEQHNLLAIYQDRTLHDETFQLELLVPSADGSQMGTAKGSIDPFFDLNTQINTLAQNAALALNPYFELPPKPTEPYPDIQAADPNIVQSLDATHMQLFQRASEHCQTLTGVKVNSAELFSNKHAELLVTSTGIRAEKTTTDLYFEVAMEKAPGPNEQEVLKYWHFIGLKDADIEAKIDSVAQETLLAGDAKLPPVRDSAVVLIDSYAISKLLAAVVSQTKGSAEFSKGPHLKHGDNVATGTVDEQSDALTLTIDPTVPQMAKTSAYTEEGLVATKAVIVNNNRVEAQIIDSRMAQYLHKETNAIHGNISVQLGQHNKESLLQQFDEVFEVLDFSSLLVNPASLTWSSEIKLGLLHQNGEPPTVIKGGIASGSIRDSLGGFLLSNEQVARNVTGGYFEAASGYVGPEHMLIWQGVKIAGEEENT